MTTFVGSVTWYTILKAHCGWSYNNALQQGEQKGGLGNCLALFQDSPEEKRWCVGQDGSGGGGKE